MAGRAGRGFLSGRRPLARGRDWGLVRWRGKLAAGKPGGLDLPPGLQQPRGDGATRRDASRPWHLAIPFPSSSCRLPSPSTRRTDLSYSLAPNGHPGGGAPTGVGSTGLLRCDQTLADDPCYASSQGDPNSDTGSGNPFGASRSPTPGSSSATATGTVKAPASRSPTPVTRPPRRRAWTAGPAFADGTGEPYDTGGVETPLAMQVRHGLTECRSSYYQNEGWNAQATGPASCDLLDPGVDRRPVHTGRVLPAVQYLKEARPAMASSGRTRRRRPSPGQEQPGHLALPEQPGLAVPEAQINGSHDQQTNVMTRTRCGQQPTPDPNQTLTGRTPEDLSNGTISISFKNGEDDRFGRARPEQSRG